MKSKIRQKIVCTESATEFPLRLSSEATAKIMLPLASSHRLRLYQLIPRSLGEIENSAENCLHRVGDRISFALVLGVRNPVYPCGIALQEFVADFFKFYFTHCRVEMCRKNIQSQQLHRLIPRSLGEIENSALFLGWCFVSNFVETFSAGNYTISLVFCSMLCYPCLTYYISVDYLNPFFTSISGS